MSTTYLVGGAVRDDLLGLPVRDRDWVVVGSTPEAMQAQGFLQVGADFPVFLHPVTREEYALARTERGPFPVFSPDVTLEEDLWRRDLTINAMALHPVTGELIDPCGGLRDLRQGVLRHASEAFADDPLRVLRVARFVAQYAAYGFSVAPETLALMRELVAADRLAEVPAERVWTETLKALTTEKPSAYFAALRQCGALRALFPEIDALFGVPQPPEHHPEVDTGLHTLLVLDRAAELSSDPETRFAALCHDLGKGTTPKAQWPHHGGHELRGADEVAKLCDRLKVPTAYASLARTVAKYHTVTHGAVTASAKTLLKLLERADAFRRPERFEQFLIVCEADAQGRMGLERQEYPQVDVMRAARREACEVAARQLMHLGLRGHALGQALHRARLRAVKNAKHLVNRSPVRDNYLIGREKAKERRL